MGYTRDDYYQEAFECAMSDEGLWHLVEQMTEKQRANIGGAIAGAAECQGMAFHTPENPLAAENRRLERRLAWECELEHCRECKGEGRLKYMAGPWHCDTGCHVCNGSGKVHPRGERTPA